MRTWVISLLFLVMFLSGAVSLAAAGEEEEGEEGDKSPKLLAVRRVRKRKKALEEDLEVVDGEEEELEERGARWETLTFIAGIFHQGTNTGDFSIARFLTLLLGEGNIFL